MTELRDLSAKLPAHAMPLLLEIHLEDGAKCTLLLEPKKPQMIAELVRALRERSPDAVVAVPAIGAPSP